MKTIKKWQEPIYAIGGFGPGFMYQLVLTYLLYFYRPAQARIETGALVFAPAGAYALGMLLARVLDGVLDIPIAGWTDNMKSRWGRRRGDGVRVRTGPSGAGDGRLRRGRRRARDPCLLRDRLHARPRVPVVTIRQERGAG